MLASDNNTNGSHLTGSPGSMSSETGTRLAVGLQQLLQVISKQRGEMAALRGLADQQRKAIQQLMMEADLQECGENYV